MQLILSSSLGTLQYTPPRLDAELPAVEFAVQVELGEVVDNRDIGSTPLSQLVTSLPRKVVLSARHMKNGVGVGSKQGVDVEASGGRKTMTSVKLAARAELDRPWAVVALADEVPMTSGAKRLTKSTERTLAMFKQLMATATLGPETLVFGVAVAGHTEGRMAQMANELVRLGAQGIVIGGAHLGEPEEVLQRAVQSVRAAVAVDAGVGAGHVAVPLMVQGADSMRQLIGALRNGVDYIASNLPSAITALGHALVLEPLVRVSGPTPPSPSAKDNSPDAKKARGEDVDEGAVTFGRYGPALNLWDARHRKDERPLVSDCGCHACRHHSRAYIHHLLQAKELLAEVLLYAHNQHNVILLAKYANEADDVSTFCPASTGIPFD